MYIYVPGTNTVYVHQEQCIDFANLLTLKKYIEYQFSSIVWDYFSLLGQ